MKTNLSKQTKYFLEEYNTNNMEFELIEIPLNKENWFYVQIDASIKYAFQKYGFKYPKYCIIEALTHYIIFHIYRDDIKNKKELLEWHNKSRYVLDELKRTAECNSKDEIEDPINWIKYEFKIS